MMRFENFVQLDVAIQDKTIEGLSEGYELLRKMMEQYLDDDAELPNPTLHCNQVHSRTPEEYYKALQATHIPDVFWDYLRDRTVTLTTPIDISPLNEGPDTAEDYKLIESHKMDVSDDIFDFLNKYQDFLQGCTNE